ncbi:hypothetical protein LIER_04196 [Lithospermum erythrorhizon]|uniref:Integrase catalytic domain-containing protein n=1 Tax=Lithospermum erythrorhizon TaxID=34254 RepID=A0AAV3NVU1_LITER
MVIAWLLHSVDRDIAESVLYCETTEQIWNVILQILLQEEKQREINNPTLISDDATALFTNRNPVVGRGRGNHAYRGRGYPIAGRGVANNNEMRPRNNLYCENCKMAGHSIQRCYKIHGYPPNNRRIAANVGDKSLTAEQFDKLVNMLDKLVNMLNGSSLSDASISGTPNVPLAGEAFCFSVTTSHLWILDSGATDHISPHLTLFDHYERALITIPDGTKIPILHIGSITLAHGIILNNGPLMKEPLELGKRAQGLYIHDTQVLTNVRSTVNKSSDCSRDSIVHVQGNVASITDNLPFAVVHSRGSHDDSTHGPYSTSTYDGYRYFLTIVDDHSKITWTHLLSTKSNAFPVFKAFLMYVQTQFQTSVKVIRSDNALEFCSHNAEQFYKDQEILHQTSCIYTPQQNGVVERKHKHLLEIARALLFQSNLPAQFWGNGLLTATYLINRFPLSSLHHISPYQMFFKVAPSYQHLRSFGCLCFASTCKQGKTKFDYRVHPYIFLGYPFSKKSYKLFDMVTHSVLYSRDVTFHESCFPYHSAHLPTSNVLPTIPSDYPLAIYYPVASNKFIPETPVANDVFSPEHSSPHNSVVSIPSSASPSSWSRIYNMKLT